LVDNGVTGAPHVQGAAILLEQQEAELAALRGVPVPVSERLRIMTAGLRLGYMAGHNDTVEGTYADPDEFAADYAPQVLGELDPLPAPQAGEVAVPVPVPELDDQHREAVHQAVAEALGSGAYDCQRVWEAWGVGTMGPDDFVPVAEDSDRVAEIADAAIEAIRAIPAPAPVPVAWCRSDEFANSMNRGGSFSGWKDPGAGANKCDMQLYAIPVPDPAPVSECPHCGYEGEMAPAPQAGEVEEVDSDHANRLGTIIPSDILQLADQLDRDGLRLIEMGYANESPPTRDTGLRVIRASYILRQQQAELATLKDDGWAKAMTDLVDQIRGDGPSLWEWGASIPTPKKVVEYLREHIDYLEHLGRVQGALTALKVDPVAESERPWEREGWCNEKGDFWAERINREGIAEWEQANRNHLGNWMVRCLPHNAIPLPPPQVGEVQA
jgi:hypothetical protein